jgi:hypothetical protein
MIELTQKLMELKMLLLEQTNREKYHLMAKKVQDQDNMMPKLRVSYKISSSRYYLFKENLIYKVKLVKKLLDQ